MCNADSFFNNMFRKQSGNVYMYKIWKNTMNSCFTYNLKPNRHLKNIYERIRTSKLDIDLALYVYNIFSNQIGKPFRNVNQIR